MKMWAAICIAAVVLTSLCVRASRRPVHIAAAPSVEVVSAPMQEAPETQLETAGPPEVEDDAVIAKSRREKALALLEEDRDNRIKLLIASIDWTRADSRIRFPIEHDLIQADYERAARTLAGK